jgi:hypothetical protein
MLQKVIPKKKEIDSPGFYGCGIYPLVSTPPIQSMDPGIFLMLRLFSDRYIFMETIKNVYDWNRGRRFPRTFLCMTDRKRSLGYSV